VLHAVNEVGAVPSKSGQEYPQGSGTCRLSVHALAHRKWSPFGGRWRQWEAVMNAIGHDMHPFLHTSHIISALTSVSLLLSFIQALDLTSVSYFNYSVSIISPHFIEFFAGPEL